MTWTPHDHRGDTAPIASDLGRRFIADVERDAHARTPQGREGSRPVGLEHFRADGDAGAMSLNPVRDERRYRCGGPRLLQVVLPDSQYEDATCGHGGLDFLRAFYVAPDLREPVRAVCCRKCTPAIGAAMPEATVHEDREPCGLEREVRDAGDVAGVHPPASDAQAHQRRAETPFGRAVSSVVKQIEDAEAMLKPILIPRTLAVADYLTGDASLSPAGATRTEP